MILNYLKLAWRSLTREKLFSFIKIGGFAVGIAACLLISLFIIDEVSYDKHYTDSDQIYRVVANIMYNGEKTKHVYFPPPMAKSLVADFPEITKAGRYLTGISHGAGGKELRRANDVTSTYEFTFQFADQSLIEIFDLKMIEGENDEALSQPNSITISQSKAAKLFPNTSAMGEQLILDNDTKNPYIITGVHEDIPKNSHLKFDYLITLTENELWEGEQDSWYSSNYLVYVKLNKGTDYKAFEKKLTTVVNEKYLLPTLMENMSEAEARQDLKNSSLILQPVSDIHLKSQDITDNMNHGDIRFVWLFAAIALFILLLACINFINLSTSKSANRAKEVGLRKTIGAHKSNLLIQFLSESVSFSFISFVVGLFLAWLILPFFNEIAEKYMFIPWNQWWFIPSVLISAIVIGLIAGLYPAIYLSSFKPIDVLKTSVNTGAKSGRLRSILVVFQFTTSIVLIIATLAVYSQMDYMVNKKLGFEKDQVLILQGTEVLGDKMETFKNELKKISQVKEVTVSDYLPIESSNQNGNTFWKAGTRKEEKGVTGQIWRVDHDYINTLGINIVEGRDFSRDIKTDNEEAIIINQRMVKQMGLDPALGAEIINHNEIWTVVGVIDDFHFNSMKTKITPLVLAMGDSPYMLSIKFQGDHVKETRAAVKQLWETFVPNQAFRYTYLDQDFAKMNDEVKKIATIFNSFALFAILVACLGLFALSAFMVEQRKKEISIRLVMGASFMTIYKLLSLDFLKLVIVAIIIAMPIGWYMMSRWLEDYAYRVELSWEIFVASGVIALIVAIVTISYQTIGAAFTNPLDGLRNE